MSYTFGLCLPFTFTYKFKNMILFSQCSLHHCDIIKNYGWTTHSVQHVTCSLRGGSLKNVVAPLSSALLPTPSPLPLSHSLLLPPPFSLSFPLSSHSLPPLPVGFFFNFGFGLTASISSYSALTTAMKLLTK